VSFRVDRATKDQLDTDDNLNTSGLMRSLVESYLLTGDSVEAGLERRLADKENALERKRLERARVDSDIEKIEREITRLEKKLEERRQATPEEVIEYAEKVKAGTVPVDNLAPDNPATENWAQKAGIHVEEFIDLVEERL